MTLGERLQQLRKEKQMSQEDLGNLLLVSRQTVSLWENNQTVPTVDNLIRLKEIFGVSIDSILTGDEPTATEVSPEAPTTEQQDPCLESYCYSVNKKDLFCLSKLYCTKPLLSTVIFFVIFIGAVAGSSEFMTFEPIAPVFFFGFFISLVSFIRCFIHLQKVKRDMCQREYVCELYQNYFVLKAYKDGGLVSTRRVLPQEIKSLWNMPYCCFIHTRDNLLFPIKKSAFEELSYMGYFCNNLTTPKTDFRTKKIALLKASASSLFVGTFVSFYLAIAYSVSGAVGVVRRDPMAMLPFCGYNMGDYFAHWIEMGKKIPHAPKIFNVNWFRTDDEGNFIWPGFGDNLRVLMWILDRCAGKADAVETAIGYLPKAEDINIEGLKDIDLETVKGLLSVDKDLWKEDIVGIKEFYAKFDEDKTLPEELAEELAKFESRLDA